MAGEGLAEAMHSLWVSCTSCGAAFPAETHPGLVRCVPCTERAGLVMPARRAARVVL